MSKKNIELTTKEFCNLVDLTEELNEINAKLKELRSLARNLDISMEREISKLNAIRKRLIRTIGSAMYEIMQEYVSEES